uniref:UDP-N-acetylglucosamine diphosphorylase n=1 Tax=Timspurckia oligopyrenoides TaxID=708627 RepID=A0A7S0ZJ50_9RHOD
METLSLGMYVNDKISKDDGTYSDEIYKLNTHQSKSVFDSMLNESQAFCVLLAAGQGSRFVSDTPKVLHPFCGKPLLVHALLAAKNARIPVVVVVSNTNAHNVIQTISSFVRIDRDGILFCEQPEQLGTGHAVYMARTVVPDTFRGDLIVSYADNPGVDSDLFSQLRAFHKNERDKLGDSYFATILTGSRAAVGLGADAYGRIVRSRLEMNRVIDIVEKKQIDAMPPESFRIYSEDNNSRWTKDELFNIDEFNSGIVIAKSDLYFKVLSEIKPSQTRKEPPKYEYYATDFVSYSSNSHCVGALQLPNDQLSKLEGANTLSELLQLEQKFLTIL